MPSETFEFHCTQSGGGCGGFIIFAVDLDQHKEIIMKCPKCGHEHQRTTASLNGSRRHGKSEATGALVVEPVMAAWSPTSKLAALERRGPIGDLWGRFAGR